MPTLADFSVDLNGDEFGVAEFVQAVNLHALSIAIVVEDLIAANIDRSVPWSVCSASDDYIAGFYAS